MFESFNGYLLKQIKSSQAVPQQICERVAVSRAFPRLAKQFLTNAAAEVKQFCNETRQGTQHVKTHEKFTQVTALGSPNVRQISLRDQAALHPVREVPTKSVVSYYKRISVNGDIVHGYTYSKTKKQLCGAFKKMEVFLLSHTLLKWIVIVYML